MEIKVCRDSSFIGECRDDDPALNWGDDISDALLSTEEAQLERGRVAIDKSFTNRTKMSLSLHQTTFIQPGYIIKTVEGVQSTTGILRDITISYAKTPNSISVGSVVGVETNV